MANVPPNLLGIWPVRAEAEPLARRLQTQLGGTVYQPWLSALPQKQQFAIAFSNGRERQWIMLGASGIALRFLDGLMHDKHSDPAVVLLDEAARFAVSLLAGHEGGANRLAYAVANAVGAVPVITTASEALKPLVLGIGCRKGVSEAQIAAAVMLALGMRALAQVREIVTIDLKAQEPGLLAFCETHDIALRVLAHATVAARAWVGQPSAWVQQNVGLDGVCEPCALIACARGSLVVPKTTLDGVAVAVAQDITPDLGPDRVPAIASDLMLDKDEAV